MITALVEFGDVQDGGPGCKRHNLLRHNRRFTVTRDRLGNWHTHRPDAPKSSDWSVPVASTS